MIFSSIFFIFVFLPAALLLYYVVPFRLKNLVLLLVSLVFYAWGEPVYVILLLFSMLFNYLSGLQLEGLLAAGSMQKAKRALITTVTVNLLVLGFYKYYGFVLENLNAVLPFEIPYQELALPIGISFYTFQVLSYVIDVYRGTIGAEHNPVTFGVYTAMFPKLVQGPIVRYADLEKQLAGRKISREKFADGVLWFLQGLGKKIVIADNMGQVFSAVIAMDASETSILTAWVGIFAYAMQLYFDFSGYSDMAVGLGKMLGFELTRNFDYPYISQSVSEFWRRWHITLGTWFRDYVYIPLGGNRVGTGKAIRNLLIVWILTGLWHGSTWNFAVWGLYYGIILCLEKYIFNKALSRMPAAGRHIYTLVIVMFSWVLFSAPTLGRAFSYWGTMIGIGGGGILDMTGFYYLKSTLILGIAAVLSCTPFVYQRFERLMYSRKAYKHVLCYAAYAVLLLICTAYMVNATYQSFLYFQF